MLRLEAVKEKVEDFVEEARYLADHDMMERTMQDKLALPYNVLVAANLAYLVKLVAMDHVCSLIGHKLQDISEAGPERGNVHLRCERCGHSHFKRLY